MAKANPGTLPKSGSSERQARSGMRMTAAERRAAVLSAAVHEFAIGGYTGTSTDSIAQRAGISQPYLFRLFSSKRELFLAAVALGCSRVRAAFEEASTGLEGTAALEAMGERYGALIADPDLLLLQLHGYAASADPEIRRAVAENFSELVSYVAERVNLDPSALRDFFALGMLCNVVAALGLDHLDQLWLDANCAPIATNMNPSASNDV